MNGFRLRLLIITLLLTLPYSVQANFSGNWQGDGWARFGNQNVNCLNFNYRFVHKQGLLEIYESGYACENGFSRRWKRNNVDIVDGKLYLRGQRIGKITDNHFYAFFDFGEAQMRIEYNLFLFDENLYYIETWKELDTGNVNFEIYSEMKAQ